MIKKGKKCSNIANINDGRVDKENPYFEVTLTPTYVNYYSMVCILSKISYNFGFNLYILITNKLWFKQRIPNAFSKKYLKEMEEIAILKVGEDMTMEVGIRFDAMGKGMVFRSGWKNFSQRYNLQIGDVCKFMMTQSKPLLFSIAITRAKMETKPKKFQGFSFLLLPLFLLANIFLN